MSLDVTAEEMMTIAAARMLSSQDVCFVGIGPPSAACNLARLTHAPDITLIYESGTIGTAPDILPLSIGDGELCDTALTTVSVPEMFRYWLQGGHITIGFLGAAQIDRFGNINTTVIGDYNSPSTRLPGGGGAPEIASLSQKVFVTMKQSRRGMGRDMVQDSCGWTVAFADEVGETGPPTQVELDVLRGLKARTAAAHATG